MTSWQNEDDLKNEDNPKNEDNLKNKDDLKNKDYLKKKKSHFRVNLILPEIIVDDFSPWQSQYNWPQTGNAISCLNQK